MELRKRAETQPQRRLLHWSVLPDAEVATTRNLTQKEPPDALGYLTVATEGGERSMLFRIT